LLTYLLAFVYVEKMYEPPTLSPLIQKASTVSYWNESMLIAD